MLLTDLAARLGAELSGPGDIEVRGISGIREAREGEVTFLADGTHLKDLDQCRASAVIMPRGLPSLSIPSLAVKNPRYAFALALRLFHEKPYLPGGVSERAVIGTNVVIGKDPTVHPFVVVADGARIGDRVTLHPGVFIGAGSVIGDDSVVHANVSIYHGVSIGSRAIIHSGAVIGSDGFGFVTEEGRHHKIPQVGGVIIGDDVEIGAGSTIDRATLGNTIIKNGTKIDNLVQIAHNVTIGEHCLLASQVGIAGSSTLGKYVVIGGQAGAADHISIGDGVMVGGGTGITRDAEPGQIVAGHPAIPIKDWLKVQAVLPKLPELKKAIGEMARRIEELEKKQ